MKDCKWELQKTVLEPAGPMGANMVEIAYLLCSVHGEVKREKVQNAY